MTNPSSFRIFTLAIPLAVLLLPTLILAQEVDESPMPIESSEAEQPAAPDFDKMSAREFFELIDFGPSYLKMLADGSPLANEEQEAVIRLVTRIRRLQPHRITRWLKLDVPWQSLAEDPESHRLEIYLLTGTVQDVRRKEVPPEAVSQVGLEHYFEVDVALDTGEGSLRGTIVVESIPAVWEANLGQKGILRGQRFSCPGIFLKPFTTVDGKTGLVFATSKISWHPNQENDALGVTTAEVRLAEQGMDIGELGNVQDRVKFEGREREAFYQMLAAVHRVPKEQRTATIEGDLSQWLTRPKDGLMVAPRNFRAEWFHLAGDCRRITRIEIDDPDVPQRLGVDHYFEVSVFVPIESPIVSQKTGDESTRKQFAHEYPVLVCVADLPPGMSAGERLHIPVAVTGAFFKLWAYRTPFMSGEDFTRRQISPLFIAASIERYSPDTNAQMDQFVLAMLIILGVVIGLGIALGVLFSRKRPSRTR